MKVTRSSYGLLTPQYISKTVTFTGAAGLGAAGAVPWFTLTGEVLVNWICGINEVDTTATAGDTLALGVTGSTSLFIAATDTANLVAAKPLWVSNAPNAYGIAIPAACTNILIATNIIATAAGTAFTAGRIRVNVNYTPMTPGAGLV